MELNDEDSSCYSNKIESVSLRKRTYDRWLINKAYLSVITVTNISHSFYLQDDGKNQLAQIQTKLHHCHPNTGSLGNGFGWFNVAKSPRPYIATAKIWVLTDRKFPTEPKQVGLRTLWLVVTSHRIVAHQTLSFEFTLCRIFTKLFRTGGSNVVNEWQVSLGFFPTKRQVLIRTASFLQKFTASENSLCMLFAN